MRHYLKRPNEKRKSFSIYSQVINSDGSTKNETLKLPELEQVNAQLQGSVITEKEALALAKGICERLNGKTGDDLVNISSANQKLLKRYWESEYSDRHLVDEDAALHKLERAMRAIEPLSLQIATKAQLASAIKKSGDAKRVRQLTSSLNQLLQFAKRDFTLRLPPKPVRQTPNHLTRSEFEIMVDGLEEKYQAPAWLAFLSGQREGEVWAAKKNKFDRKRNYVDVANQMTRSGEFTVPKHGSIRNAYCLPGYAEWLEVWQSQDHSEVSRTGMSHAILRRCQQLWPNRIDKHCTTHDLRHSYAIILVPIIGIEKVAQSLGNTVAVCQEYYAGFSLTDEGIDVVHEKVMQALSS